MCHYLCARVGGEVVFSYHTGVGFRSLLIYEQGNAKASETGKQM